MKRFQLGAPQAYLTLFIVSLVTFCFSSGSLGQESFKIGVVNTQEVLEGAQEAKDANDILQAEGDRLRAKLDNLLEEIKTLQEKRAKIEQFVENGQTADLDTKIRFRQEEYQQELDTGRQKLLEKEQELMGPILNKLQERIVNVGESEDFDIILEKRLITLYVKKEYDLTQQLIGLMNENSE